jgi:hypothetical protein
MRLPDVPGFNIVHGHEEGDPCGRWCYHRASLWTTIRIRTRMAWPLWAGLIIGVPSILILLLLGHNTP